MTVRDATVLSDARSVVLTACIIVARDRGGTVVTDDPVVSERCRSERVATITGTLLVVHLFEAGL